MVKNIFDSSGPHLPWAGKQVRTEHVEEELSLLWRISADNVRTSQHANVRTSILNFVICASDVESAQHASMLLRDLCSTHIARVVLLILDNSTTSPTAVSTWVTLRSFSISSDVMRHSFEQITLMVSGTAIRSLNTIVQPLLRPDLQAYLWWLNDPPTEHNLLKLSSRVIVDSNSFFTPEQSISRLSSLLQASPHSALSDLNWGRLTLWRELIAQFFDVQEYKSYLVGVNRIDIEHTVISPTERIHTEQGEVSPNSTQALLLAGWLKTRLDWKLAVGEAYHDPTTGTHSWKMAPTSNTVEKQLSSISIRPRIQHDIPPGSLYLLRMVSSLENNHATFTIKRDFDHVFTSVELTQGTGLQRSVNMAATHQVNELLHDELKIMGHDHLYEQTLQEVFELLLEQ